MTSTRTARVGELLARHRRRFMVLAVVLAVALCTLALRPTIAAYARARLMAAVAQKLTEAAGRPVVFAAAEVSLTGLVLEGVRVPARGDERSDPLRVRRAEVGADWWRVLRGRPGGLRGVRLDGVALRVVRAEEGAGARPEPPARPWTAVVLDVGREGLGEIEVRDGAVRVEDAGGAVLFSAEGARLSLRIETTRFAYRLGAASAVGAGLVASAVEVEGTGDARGGLEVARARADGAGGRVELRGGLDANSGAWHAAGRALGVQLGPLASLPAWPAGVGAAGAADAEFVLRARGDELDRAEATVRARGAGEIEHAGGRFAWQSAEGRVAFGGGEIALSAVRVRGEGLALEGGLTLRAGADGHFGGGRVEARARVSADAAALSRWCTGLRGLTVRGASADVSASVTLGRPATLEAEGEVRAQGLRWRAGRGSLAVAAERARGRFAYRAAGSRLSLRDVAVEARAGRVTGRAEFAGQARTWAAEVEARGLDAEALRAYVPAAAGALRGGRVDATVALAGANGALATAAGRVRVENARYAPPAGAPLAEHVFDVARASGRFEYAAAGGRVALQDLLVESREGRVAGRAEFAVAGAPWRAEIDVRGLDAELLRRYVPGELRGGRVAATVSLAGSAGGLDAASGRVQLEDARYTPPREMPFAARALAVARASAGFQWDRGRLRVEQIALRSDRVSGEGALQAGGGRARLHAELRAGDLGAVAETFPVLAGMLRGGRGRGTLDLVADGAGTRGAVVVDAEDTAVVAGSVQGAQGVAPGGAIPIAAGHARIEFSPAGISVREGTLRGPIANANASVDWRSRDGGLHVVGSAWLTHETTMGMLVGWRWLAHIVRFRQIGSDFEITGTDARPVLRASAAHGLLWHFGKKRLSPEARAMARGEMPLWDHSAEARR